MKAQSTPSRISIDIAVRTPPAFELLLLHLLMRRGLRLGAACRKPAVPRAAPADPARRCRDIRRREYAAATRSAAAGRAANRRASGTDCRAAASSARCASARSRRAFQRWIGSTKPLGTSSPRSNTRAMRERSSGSGSLESAGIDIERQAASFCSQCAGSSNAGMTYSESTPSFLRRAFREALGVLDPRLVRVLDRRRSDRSSSRSARRPCASRARTPSAAGFRRDTICPARNAAARPARTASRSRRIRSSASAALGRADRGDIPFRRLPDRRPRRRSARRPWSGARRPPSRSASTCSPSRSRRAQDSSENGLVMRGASRMRLTLISKPNSTLANPTAPEIGAAER